MNLMIRPLIYHHLSLPTQLTRAQIDRDLLATPKQFTNSDIDKKHPEAFSLQKSKFNE